MNTVVGRANPSTNFCDRVAHDEIVPRGVCRPSRRNPAASTAGLPAISFQSVTSELAIQKVDETENVYSARIGLAYRALGVMDGSVIVWFWIGSHAEYDRLV